MPIEINEIGIRMRVRDEGDARGTAPGLGPSHHPWEADREALVAECVRRVLQALKTGRER
jgi:Family of unknown function (DUF5908)